MKSLRLCAEHYLRQWCNQDRGFHIAFSSDSIRCELLGKMCWDYQVARTVPGQGLAKYEQFANMINRYRGITIERQDVPDIIEKELASMKSVYKKGFLSAITKAFWMMKRHPIVIYDSNARKGLRYFNLDPGDGDYRAYFDSWFSFFDRPEIQNGLTDAADWLLEKKKIQDEQLRNFVKSDHFRNRVTDMRLFYAGAAATEKE